LTFGPPDLVGLGEPRLRQEQPFVHQGIALARGIGGEDPYLAILHLPYGAAVLAGAPPGGLALFCKARLLEDQHPTGPAHLLLDHALICPQHGVVIPERLTEEPLHRPDLAALHLQGYRFDGFAGEGTELPHHRVEKLVPWFLPGKTRPKGRMEPTEFVHKSVDLAPSERKLGNGKRLVCRPTGR